MRPKKTVLITGASSGIGEATALTFAANNADLVLIARREDRLIKLKEKIEAAHDSNVKILGADITNLRQLSESMTGDLEDCLEKIDVIVNSAGLAMGRYKFYEHPKSEIDQVIDTNLKGLLFVNRMVIPHMIKKKSGHIINIGSVSGKWTYPQDAAYCMSKFAVSAISNALRLDLKDKNIKVTNIDPGRVKTDLAKIRLGGDIDLDIAFRGYEPLLPEDISEIIRWTVFQPDHIEVQEIVVFPTDQASVYLLAKK